MDSKPSGVPQALFKNAKIAVPKHQTSWTLVTGGRNELRAAVHYRVHTCVSLARPHMDVVCILVSCTLGRRISILQRNRRRGWLGIHCIASLHVQLKKDATKQNIAGANFASH